jgi:hypothetical protein
MILLTGTRLRIEFGMIGEPQFAQDDDQGQSERLLAYRTPHDQHFLHRSLR